MKTYPTKSRIRESKKRIYEIATKSRRFGVVRVDYDLYDRILTVTNKKVEGVL